MEEKKSAAIHKLMLERQKGGTITGIRDVISFDEKEILLHTEDGKLSIKGETLHVKHLDLEHGELSLEGRIDSLAYLGRKKEKQEAKETVKEGMNEVAAETEEVRDKNAEILKQMDPKEQERIIREVLKEFLA